MPSKYSPEGRLNDGLHGLGCTANCFAQITGVNRRRISDALDGRDDLDNSLAEKLRGVLMEMQTLRAEAGVPINWECTQEIETALVIRRLNKVAQQSGDDQMSGLAQVATTRLKCPGQRQAEK